jgi:hypothetical protein
MKTLEDLIDEPESSIELDTVEQLKKEAVKWLKQLDEISMEQRAYSINSHIWTQTKPSIIPEQLEEIYDHEEQDFHEAENWIKLFFNIKEDDLK